MNYGSALIIVPELDNDNYNIIEFIKSGKYFTDARKWYNTKYLRPYVDRTKYLACSIVIVCCLLWVLLAINDLLPIRPQIKYSISVSTVNDNQADIHHLSPSQPTRHQIAQLIIKNYVIKREEYDYERLQEQMGFVRDTTSKAAYAQYYEYMSLKNPQSPLLRYQKYGHREIKIDSIKILKNNIARVIFHSKATNFDGQMFENLKWEALASYQDAPLDIHATHNTDYKFVITGYKLKLLK